MHRSFFLAIATISILLGSAVNASAGSVAMDNGGDRNKDIEAYVDLYGKAATGNRVALENLRVLSRIYTAQTLVEAADLAFKRHGILVYPADATEVADTSSKGDLTRRGG